MTDDKARARARELAKIRWGNISDVEFASWLETALTAARVEELREAREIVAGFGAHGIYARDAIDARIAALTAPAETGETT